MNILILYNNPDRELTYLNDIRILLLENEIVENVLLENGGDTKKVILSVFKFKPAVILSYPLTGKSLPHKFHILKLIFNFKFICLRTEGSIDKGSKEEILNHVGISKYSIKLVDLELFWGPIQKELLGPELLLQNKITSMERCLVVGYPRIKKTERNGIKKNKNLIGIFTGFHVADYDETEFLRAKDLDKNIMKEFLEQGKKVFAFREEFIMRLDTFLSFNKHMEFIIKLHPAENEITFHKLLKHDNIEILPKNTPLDSIFENLKSFVHFGSTTLLDSYIYKIPSLLVFDKTSNIGHSYGWNSTLKSTLEELHFNLKLLDDTKFKLSDKIKSTLFEEINFEFEKPYNPVQKICQVILFDKNSIQALSFFSKHTFYSIFTLIKLSLLKFAVKVFSIKF